MRILANVATMASELATGTNAVYAIIATDDDETVKYIENRKVLFNSVSDTLEQIDGSDDLLFLQFKDFVGVGFFDNDLELSDEQHKELFKKGYIEVEDGYGDEYEVVETEMEMLCIGANGFWVIATDENGIDVRTCEIPYDKT